MAQEIVMPKLGNTVESVVIVEWKKDVGDSVAVGDAICEVETDKATVDVEAETAGTLLAQLFETDDDVPVLVPFAIIGDAGEDISGMTSGAASALASSAPEAPASANETGPASQAESADAGGPAASAPAAEAAKAAAAAAAPQIVAAGDSAGGAAGISPRARNLAASSGLSGVSEAVAAGSGPGGRIIERDVQAVLDGRAPLTPAAKAAGSAAPSAGTGIGGRVTTADIAAFDSAAAGLDLGGSGDADSRAPAAGDFTAIPVKGIRQIIAQRMHASLLETAQLTLNTSANAESMLSWRAGFKNSPEDVGVSKISINDLIMYTAAKLLKKHPELNATFLGGEIRQYHHVNLGFAVDTPRGLMVPVIRNADELSLSELSVETRRLAAGCREGKVSPDELSGGTFTITNLGAFGIESFTPVLNAPEVAILGVGTIVNSPIEKPDGSLGLEKRMGLSLTIDHQAVDGAPGARFLKDLTDMLAHMEWVLAL